MLEAYSSNITVVADQAIPFNNLALKKGCTVELITPTTLQFNKCGIYRVTCNASAGTASGLSLYKNGTLQPQSTSEGENPCVDTFVVAEQNANDCPCSIPTTAQIIDDTAGTLTNVSIKVVKVK